MLMVERNLLQKVIDRWQRLLAAEQGKLGEAALRALTPAQRRAEGIARRTSAVWQKPTAPFDNPYVAGNPVRPPLFVGRQDVFHQIEKVWSAKGIPNSIVLTAIDAWAKAAFFVILTRWRRRR